MIKKRVSKIVNKKILTSQNSSRRDFIKQVSCLGSAAAIQSLGLTSLLAASKALAVDDYKALVFIFLDGGNDAFNMLVPRGAGQLRDDYEAGRRVVALPASDLQPINLTAPASIYGGEVYNDFGLHPACDHMADLFNNQEMSVICNVGNLYEPTTRDQFFNGGSILPPQLFSHADQQQQFQSEPALPFRFGWGGRLAELTDIYNSASTVSPLISMSGLNAFQVSRDSVLNPYTLGTNGVTPLWNYKNNVTRKTMVEDAMASIDSASHLMMQKHRDIFNSAIQAEAIINGAFNEAENAGIDYDAIFSAAGAASSKVGSQLKTIAKMIAGRSSTGNNRPVFFVKVTGFDAHQNLLADHSVLMGELNAALKGFRDALTQQSDFDKVLSFVGSEFGRTLTPNGDDATTGTDHAWGGHALVMGGMINGGQLFGEHPDLKLNEGLDASGGRGRWVPTTSTTQCASVIAHWFGVSKPDLPQLFPTVAIFPDPFHIDANLGFINPGVGV
jgi:uncharacterized protein (DUF1501 family)